LSQAQIASSERKQYQDQLDERNKEINKLRLIADAKTPEAIVANSFDKVLLGQFEAHTGSLAQLTLSAMRGATNIGSFGGDAFFQVLVDLTIQLERCKDHLEDTRAHRAIRADAIKQLEELLPKLDGLTSFESDSVDWIDHDKEGDQLGERFKTVTQLVQGESGLLASSQALITARDQERIYDWAGLKTGPALQSPAMVIELTTKYEDESQLGQHLTLFAGALDAHLVVAGRLEVGKLMALGSLDEWTTALTSRKGLGTAAERGKLALFQFAKRWNTEADWTGSADDAKLFGDTPLQGPINWKTSLYLAHQLTLESSAYPAPTKGQSVHRIMVDGTEWLTTRRMKHVRDADSSNETWNVEVKTRSTNGREIKYTDPFKYVRTGKVFNRGKNVVLDLQDSSQLVAKTVPPGTIVKASDLLAFQKNIQSTPLVCLYQKAANGTERWFSPRYGLVREKIGNDVTELVFGN
jgi:hypothetical protein